MFKRLLERCLNSTYPGWNEGVEHSGPVVPSERHTTWTK